MKRRLRYSLRQFPDSTYHGKGVTEELRPSGERSALGLGELLEQLTADPGNDGEELRGHFRWCM